MISSLGKVIVQYPTSFGNWACLLQEIIAGTDEIAVVGKEFAGVYREILDQYIPHRVMLAAPDPDTAYPLLAGKPTSVKPVIFLCRNYTCEQPVFSAIELRTLINKAPKA